MRRLRGSKIGADRDVHADVTGSRRKYRADRKTDRRQTPQCHPDDHEQQQSDQADGPVLPVKVSGSALLNGRSDFHHSRISRRLRQYPHNRHAAVDDCEYSTCQSKHDTFRHQHLLLR